MKRITATQAKKALPGMHRADDTLFLRVKPSGRKSWVQRVVFKKRRLTLGLGPYPIVTLEEARQKAFDNRRMIYNGESPIQTKRRSSIPTFRKAAERYHATLKPTWNSKVHAKSWMQVVERHTFPKLGNIPVDEITQQDVLNVLKPIWVSRNDTATRVRQRIRGILNYCQAHEYITTNPAGEAIDAALPSQHKKKKNFRALPYHETPAAAITIEGITSGPVRLCLNFLLHTATRSSESLGARWSEIDLEAATWTIPAERMKGGKPHRVPLSPQAVAILEQARPMRNDSGLIFPSVQTGKAMTSATLKKHMVKVGLWEKTVVHGFRTSFRTWAEECTDQPHAVKEMALSHEVGSAVERAYSRSDLLEKRVNLMNGWSEFVTG